MCGGAKMMALLAFYALNSTAFFVFLPAGRDIVSWPTPLLPGEELSRPAMDATSKALRPFTWGFTWGDGRDVQGPAPLHVGPQPLHDVLPQDLRQHERRQVRRILGSCLRTGN